MTLVINCFGGPGTGKSTTAAGLFRALKIRGFNCEMALEYAKDKVWEESFAVLGNQNYIFGKQYHKLHRLLNKVDIIVTDAPLALSLMYGKMGIEENCWSFFEGNVLQTFNNMNNLNIFLIRKKPYQSAGRTQTEEEAIELDHKILEILKHYKISYHVVIADGTEIEEIMKIVDNNKEV